MDNQSKAPAPMSSGEELTLGPAATAQEMCSQV
jgi:hypothetical protein